MQARLTWVRSFTDCGKCFDQGGRVKKVLFLSLMVIAIAVVVCVTPSIAQDKKLQGKTVNINKASVDDLMKNVPLMTKELATNIVKYRKENGDFTTVEELLQVPGMNRDLLKKIKVFFLLEGIGGKDCTC
jgi:competence ComEA-like helix-hairpin-helix protein